jgi:hypothetical protein
MHRKYPYTTTGTALLAIVGLALATVGCTYSKMGVGKGGDITAEQMRAYAYDQAGGDLPVPIVDHPGKGRVVQMDRMITMDIAFRDLDDKPISSSQIRFVHSSRDKSLSRYAGYTFGYVSQKLLDAMAGMREGGSRKVQITDSTCEDLFQSKFLSEFYGNPCQAVGAMREAPYGPKWGGINYPKGKPVVANITIVKVCKPWIVREDFPDLMGGGPQVRLVEIWCR